MKTLIYCWKGISQYYWGFLSILLGTLGASLLGNLLTGNGIYRAGKGKGTNRVGETIARAGYSCPTSSASHNNKMDF